MLCFIKVIKMEENKFTDFENLKNCKKSGFRKIKDVKQKVLFTLAYISILLILRCFQLNCFFDSIFGIPCPGCGMTRAVSEAIRFNFHSAFQYHAMFWSIPFLFLYFLYDGHLFKNKILNKSVFIIIATGFLISWIVKICRLFQ